VAAGKKEERKECRALHRSPSGRRPQKGRPNVAWRHTLAG
jgi:hypothetical protein